MDVDGSQPSPRTQLYQPLPLGSLSLSELSHPGAPFRAHTVPDVGRVLGGMQVGAVAFTEDVAPELTSRRKRVSLGQEEEAVFQARGSRCGTCYALRGSRRPRSSRARSTEGRGVVRRRLRRGSYAGWDTGFQKVQRAPTMVFRQSSHRMQPVLYHGDARTGCRGEGPEDRGLGR